MARRCVSNWTQLQMSTRSVKDTYAVTKSDHPHNASSCGTGRKTIPKGETVLQVFNPKTAATNNVRVMVVQNQFTCLLGLETVKRLKFVTINDDKFILKLEISGALGDLGEARFSVDPSKKPKQN
ncbi:hypothetical protein ElyMa_003629100 [Elysia marginata]|uniref:Uncharacterized protein n=1 Tax=Elysia marginata TaxID=1093978 RepID=A0AAV4EU72_9GAST|nr:hypothetical protein ElyMa_003629100 [Elysia marginata]